ncbi:MAG: PAS domain S-box protein [Flavobacteriales bacterium]|nr:PAS domain S-box protein [Flavobacteriales bacterium]
MVSGGMDQYDDLFSSGLLGLFRTSVTGRMLDCNLALARLLGYASREELMAVPVEKLYFDLHERQQYLEDLLQKKQLNDYEILLKHRSGRPLHVLEKVILRETAGRASIIEGAIFDITSLRQSELEQRALANNYRQLAEQLRDGMVVLQNGRVVYANPAAEMLVGIGLKPGAEFLDAVGGRGPGPFMTWLRQVEQGEKPVAIRTLTCWPGMEPRHLLVHGGATRHMNRPAIQLTLQDVEAERSLMEERMRATMAEEGNAKLRAVIDENRRTHEALMQSRRLAKSLIDSSLDMIVAVDRKNNITEFNPAATIKFGFETEEVLGRCAKLLYADEGEFDRVQQELTRYGAFAGEVRNITKEGRVFTSFLAASRLMDEEGTLLGSMGVSRDVTQAKRDREAMRESEERYRDLVDNANDLIHSVDGDGKFLFTNNAWKRVLGYTEQEIQQLSVTDILAEESTRQTARKWLAGERSGTVNTPWRSTFLTRDGQIRLFEGSSTVREENGRMILARSIFRDITESHAAQEKLLKHAAKEKALFDSSAHMFWTVDRRIALTSFNKGYQDMILRLHGKVPHINTDPGKPRELFATAHYHDFWKEKYDEAFSGKVVRFETDLTDLEGNRVCNEIYLSPVMDSHGGVQEVFGIGHEITAERAAEALAREQSAKLNAIFDNSVDVLLWSVDKDLRITSCNRFFSQVAKLLYGGDLGVGDNIQDTFKHMVTQEEDQEWFRMYRDCFDGKPQRIEKLLVSPTGASMWLELFMGPIQANGGINEVTCMAHDITGKKNAEREMVDNLREKEVLLKEVHHRVKNNLQIISSIFSLQRAHMAEDPRIFALLQESQNRIRSMAFIHESLYQSKNFAQVDLAQYIKGLCSNLVMSYSLYGRVQLNTDLEPLMLDLDKAIPCGLVLNELISNALKHAFPGDKEGVVGITMRSERNTVRITLEDNGTGFPAVYREEQDRGLGMELVELLIQQLDGSATRLSGNGEPGTSYLITFERS